MSLAGSLAASLLATLARPAWWPMALAGFLVRGGILVAILPIVTLPTVAGLANAFAPALVGFVFGGPSPSFVAAVAAIVVAVLGWLVLGGLVGGGLDLALVRDAARDEELEAVAAPRFGGPGRALAVRVMAHLPTGAAIAVGAYRLVEASYAELIRPGDPAIPVALRVALRIPEIVALLAATWLIGEAIGGLAVRHIAWGASVPASLGRAIRSLARPSGLATLVITDGVLAAVIAGSATAAAITWDHLRVVLMDHGPASEVRPALIVFSLTWIAGLWLIALAVAWRSTAWTFEVGRHLPARTLESHEP
ncbi:MAG: hypothetical protein L0227_17815 [Chloroflexi bacterium]|nr:hypothetical protein [Chloroflexota bacterium]